MEAEGLRVIRRKEPKAREAELLQMITVGRTKQEWDLLAKAASVTVNNQQQQYFSLPPLPLLPNLRPPCESISSLPPGTFVRQVLLDSAKPHRCCCLLLPPSHCCASFHCPARPLRLDTNPRAIRQRILHFTNLTVTRRFDSSSVSEKHCESGATPQTPPVSRSASVTASTTSS